MAGRSKTVAQGSDKQSPNIPGVPKAHFRLRRMNVYVNIFRVQLDK